MFIPLHDSNSLKYIRLQFVTLTLILINVAVFAMTSLGTEDASQAAIIGLGYIPAVVHDFAELGPELTIVPDWATYVTYAFFHGDLMHIIGNMLFLWVFGDNVEDALGHVKFLFFYLACAVAGALVHGLALPESEVPLIGASGAVAGVVSAYLLLHPRVRVWVLAFARFPLRVPAWIPLVLWIGLQFFMFATSPQDEVSWGAHVGGILAGIVLVVILKRRSVPLFDRAVVTPRDVVTEAPAPPTLAAEKNQPLGPWGRRN
jgi:membrane associated rhomboid family serine protease